MHDAVASGILDDDEQTGNVHTGEGINKDELARVNASVSTDVKGTLNKPANTSVSALVKGSSQFDAGTDLTVNAAVKD